MRVIKIGGRAQDDPCLAETVARLWKAAPGALCIVHGGGDEISALQRAMGVTPRFVGGRRVTDAADIALVRMALSGAANKRLVSRLVSAGMPAVGLSGEDAGLIAAEPDADGALGRVGVPVRIAVALLRHLLGGGYLPVVSPLASDATALEHGGDALNVNGDDAAASIAVALGADELVLVADVPGVMVGDRVAPVLDGDDVTSAIATGVAAGGMAAKLQAGLAALERGVGRVRIGDLDSLLDSARGTRLAPSRSLV